MSKLELSIAWRYLRGRRGSRLLSLISVIAIGGVVVGVSALIVVMGVMNGLQRDLRDKILIGSPDIRVLTFNELIIRDWRSVIEKVGRHPEVVAAAPFVHTQGVATSGGDYTDGVNIVGIEPAGRGVAEVTEIRDHATTGDFRFRTSSGEVRGIALGKMLSEKLNAFVGDSVTIFTVKSGTEINAVIGAAIPEPSKERFEVTAVFETGMYEYDNQYVYMPLQVAQSLAGLDTAVTGVELKTTDRWRTNEVAGELSHALGFPYRLVDWQEQNRSLFRALKLEKLGMGLILLLIVLVAAFNIVSNLTMVVSDKTREIGILRAMGMTGRSIRNVFVAQGLVIGLAGTLLGVSLGLAVALALGSSEIIKLDPSIYFIDHLPVATELADVLTVIGASVVIATVATLYPAIQAARLYPVQAIRHE